MPEISLESMQRRLAACGQTHLLRFYAELQPEQRQELLRQLADLPLERVPSWAEDYVLGAPAPPALPAQLHPVPVYRRSSPHAGSSWDAQSYHAHGEELLRQGRVAAFVVAGGQGTRLGYGGPKGEVVATPLSGLSLFEVFAAQIRAARRRYGTRICWYVMTSLLNHERTLSYFREKAFFGLPPDDVLLFPQGVLPSFDAQTGRLLLAERGRVATNPDGHGGSLHALYENGALDHMRRRGVEVISYFQVDNPLVRIFDPVFIGLHASAADSSGEMSSKMVLKTDPAERVGAFVRAGGRTQVVEYSDLSPEQAAERRPDGGLVLDAGSIAIHLLSVDFVSRLHTDGVFRLPLHRALKRVDHVDLETGALVRPAQPNAVKLETFVFDALPLCEASLVYETERTEEFAPIKNATGGDSLVTSRAGQIERAARWLERAGVEVPRRADGTPDCVLEIQPELEERDLGRIPLPARVERGAEWLCGASAHAGAAAP